MREALGFAALLLVGGAVLLVANNPDLLLVFGSKDRQFYQRVAEARALDRRCDLLDAPSRRRLTQRMFRMAEDLTPSLREKTDPLAAADRLADIEDAAATAAARADCTAAETANRVAGIQDEVVGADFAEAEALLADGRETARRCDLLTASERALLEAALTQVQSVIGTRLTERQQGHYNAWKTARQVVPADGCAEARQRLERALDQARSAMQAAT